MFSRMIDISTRYMAVLEKHMFLFQVKLRLGHIAMKQHRTSSLKDFSYFITIYRISGLVPFSSRPTGRVLLTIYQLVHLLLVALIFLAAFFVYNAFQEDTLSNLVSGLVYVALSVAHTILILQAFFTREKQREMFDMFTLIDSDFRNKLIMNVDMKRWNRKYMMQFLIIMVIVLGNDAQIVISKLIYGYNDGFWFGFLSRQIVRLRLLQCVHYVQMASERLNLLNGKVEEIMASRKVAPRLILLESDYGKNRYDDRIQSNAYAAERILILKQIFGHIWEVTNIINDTFGWSLLAIVTYYFLDFTSNGYWLFLALENIVSRYVLAECLCRMIPLALMLSILSWVCNNCKQMSVTTGCLVHKLEKSTESEQYNALVSEFSLQIMHEPFHISANGFFTIDFELLGSMAAATVTYLVILIQFLLNDKNHKDTSATNTTKSTSG